jgi:hypothetical protein
MTQDTRNSREASLGKPWSVRGEFTWLSLILILGLAPRLLFVISFPTIPFSDFHHLLDFALLFRDDWLARGAWHWDYFSPGLPLGLAVILRFAGGSPEAAGRWSTAFVTGLVPLLPYLAWRGVFPARTRILAALLLALWPAQILFSSVLAQDNWILFPAVGVTVLAVRALVLEKEGSSPVLAALLYGLAGAIRQEMIVVLLPAAVIAILGRGGRHRVRSLLLGAALIGILFAGLVIQRGLATGSYTFRSEHAGKAMLGAYVPGAGLGWIDPIPYVKSRHPELTEREDLNRKLAEEGAQMAWDEFTERPRFHLTRMVGSMLTHLLANDGDLVWWSLGGGMLPPGRQAGADRLFETAVPLLRIHRLVVHMLFAASLFFCLRDRSLLLWISPLLVTIALKAGVHAVLVSQPRYYLVVLALELLVISVAAASMVTRENWNVSLRSAVLGIASILVLLAAMNYARNYVNAHALILREPPVDTIGREPVSFWDRPGTDPEISSSSKR